MQIAAIDRLLDSIANARLRPEMYFEPVDPAAVIHWLSGVRLGFQFFGLIWHPDYRRGALNRRGLEPRSAWEAEELASRGLSSKDIVSELLAIEFKMWQTHKAAIG